MVGCKSDLVSNADCDSIVTKEMIEQKLQNSLASLCIITSSRAMYNIDKLFKLAISETIYVSKSSKKGRKKVVIGNPEDIEPTPPIVPPARKAPRIYVESSNYGKGFKNLLDSDFCCDTKFVIYNSKKDIDVEIKAHSLVLACVPSKVIGKLFDEVLVSRDAGMNSYSHEAFEKLSAKINGGRVSGFSSVSIDENEPNILKFRLSNTIHHRAFKSLLEIQYYGGSETMRKRCKKDQFLNKVKIASTIFECEYTDNIVSNYQRGEEDVFNESIETYLNDLLGSEIKKKYFDKKTHSDVEIVFSTTDSSKNFHGHKLFLSANCDVFRTMFEANFVEHSSRQVDLSGEIGENENRISEFHALFEYLYSAHSTINERNAVGLLSLANEYGKSGLISLCEIFISKNIDKSVAQGIENADIDTIGLLLLAQTYEANQLANFCLHFISTNYGPMKARREWELLTGENLKHVTENKWPPDSYYKKVEEYKKKREKYRKKLKKKQSKSGGADLEIDDVKKKCFIQ